MQEESPYPVVYEDTTIIRLRPAPRPPSAAEESHAPAPPPRAMAVPDSRGARKRVVSPRLIAAGSVAALLALLVILAARFGTHAALTPPVPAATPAQDLHEAPSVVRPATSTDSLRELLTTHITQGVVQVEPESNGGVLLTLTPPDLFDSGRDSVNPRYVGLIHAIGAVLQRESGHFLVIGHTDDQGIHTARFPDNVALSLERARQVAQLLKEEIGDGGRVDITGVGSRQPLYLPESLPANRARNRRIEIAVQSGG